MSRHTQVERHYVDSPEWFDAFPSGVTRDTSHAPPIDDSHTGNPWIDPATGKKYPGAPGKP
ncbi:MAG TPA: hypothetical protein VI653_09480 [Steroidobacteraceae bacterium]